MNFLKYILYTFILLMLSGMVCAQWGTHGYYDSLNSSGLVHYRQQICISGNAICIVAKAEVNDLYILWFRNIPPEGEDPFCETHPDSISCKEDNECAPTSANPIDFSTGNKFFSEMDSDGSLPLFRVYETNPRSPVSDYRNLWSLNLGSQISLNIEPNYDFYSAYGLKELMVDLQPKIYEVMLPKQYFELKDGQNSKLIELDKNGNFYSVDGYEDLEVSRIGSAEGSSYGLVGGGYLLSYSNGDKKYFSALGKIVREESVSGAFKQYSYVENEGGLYTTVVTNEHGHSASLTYIEENHAIYTDVNNHEYHYVFDAPEADNPRLKVIFPDNTPNTLEDNLVIEYEHNSSYDANEDPTATNGTIKTVYVDGDVYLSYAYDPITGHAIHSEKIGGLETDDIVYEYDQDGLIEKTTHTNSKTKETIYHFENISGRQVVTDVEGVASSGCAASNTSYTYDSNGYRRTATNSRGFVTETVRDAEGNVTQERRGLTWSAGVDSTLVEGNDMAQIDTPSWHPDLNKPLERTHRSKSSGAWQDIRRENWLYDAGGRELSYTVTDLTNYSLPYATYGRTRTTTISYTFHDANESIIATRTVNGPLDPAMQPDGVDDITIYTYNPQGQLTQRQNADGQVVQYSNYLNRGLPQTVIDANGVPTTLTYTPRGWLDTVTVENGANDAVTDYDYDAVGQVTDVTLPNGVTLRYDYDGAHRLYRITDGEGNYLHYTLDNAGNIEKEEIFGAGDVLLRSVDRVYDELSRLRNTLGGTQGADRFENVLGYDVNDNLETSQLGGLSGNDPVVRLYDALDRIQQINHADGGSSHYQYDAQNNLTQVTDPAGQITTYQYDGLGNLMQVTSPDSGITTYTYDAAGNRTSQTDARGVVTQYQYDALNRLTHVLYPAGPQENVTYSYDDTGNDNHGIGRMTGLRDTSGITAYYYNALGQLTERHQLLEGLFYRWGFGYDLAGNLTSLRYPSGRTVTYSRNTLGQIDGITTTDWDGATAHTLATNVQYRPFGPLHQFDYGNGVTHTVSHDLDYRISGVSDTVGSTDLRAKALSYYNTGNLEDILDSLNSANNQLFTYDPENRLNTATGVYGDLDYDYDPVGNRTQQRVDTNQDGTDDIIELYSYLNPATGTRIDNRLHQVTINSTAYGFSYDEAGNLMQDTRNNQSFTYNAAGRMETMNDATANAGDYRYNGLGQRVIKLATHASLDHHHYHYAPDGKLLAITAGSDGRALAEYVYLEELRIAQLNPDASADADSDGMDDKWEIQHFGDTTTSSGSNTDDADGDGVLDIVEFIGGTDPTNTTTSDSDTDGDTLPDTWEYLHFGNLQQDATTDYDGDGLSDGKEYQLQYDPTRDSLTWLVPFLFH